MLNQLGFYVFLPALAFSKLAQSISWHDLAIWWPLPLNVFIKCALQTARCCVVDALSLDSCTYSANRIPSMPT